MIRIAVVDDEKEILEFVTDRIIRALNHFKYEAKVDRYLSGKTFLKNNDNYEYDIVFLDLEMPGFNGLQTARSIRIDFPNEIIVIVTNRDDLVFDTFQYDVSAFIRKQYIDTEINSVIERVYNKAKNKRSEYMFKSENGEIYVKSKDIIYIEVHNHDVYLYLSSSNQTIKIYYTLEVLCTILSDEYFVKCHQSYIVGLEYIDTINNDTITLTNNKTIPLSRSRKKEVKSKFQRFMRSI